MLKRLTRLLALFAAAILGSGLQAQMPEGTNRTAPPTTGGDKNAIIDRATRRRTLAMAREAAAVRSQAALKAKGGKVDPSILGVNPAASALAAQAAKVAAKAQAKGGTGSQLLVPGPGFQLAQPDYMFGTASNWHNTKPIAKFVDTLPGLGAANANNLGNYIPVATPDTTSYPGSDYYQVDVVEYTQQLHSGLNSTKLRGYVEHGNPGVNTVSGGASNYLGPVIIARKDRPVRVKMTNLLPTGTAGDLFIPVDTTMMGAGVGPNGGMFTQNRAELHLHGGLNPWISDGTPHQWVTPAGDTLADGVTPIPYPKGAVFQNVPDMAAGATPTDGVGTYFWSNQQSGRFMFYHDHSFGLTRLNVYAGEAAGYLIVDPTDDKLINSGVLPNQGGGVYTYGIPLVIQDKTFVDTTTLGTVGVAGGTDPTWDVAKYGGDGSLWYPHVYMPNQNPADISGANAMGRWDYGAWFWPPLPLAVNNNGVGLQHGAEPVVGDPNGTEIPGTPNPSLVPEAFMDTPVVNGQAYPTITVQPQAYRFRILNAANDRFWNLSFFTADPAAPTEVVMVPSAPNAAWPATWPTDGRAGGVPDPATAGPSFIQIGNESGYLPAPVVIPPQPISYNYNRRDIVVLNVQDKGLFLGCAERADVIVDFSAYAGKTLILYNDGPAPVPAFDTRLDYYTGDPDQRDSGGAATTLPGFGPNTRTIMQFKVAAGTPVPFNLAALNAAFTSTATSNGAFAESQHVPIVPQLAYNAALNKPLADATSLAAAGMSTTPASFANNVYVRIQDNQIRYPFPSMENGSAVRPALAAKAIQELFELDYGRMNATLGVELPLTNFTNQTTIPLGYADPATENLTDGTTQYWKITHNGVDTHPVHFHLFDVQIVNRVGWDGAVRLPDANELGWKETVKMNPLEDIIVAFRPLSPRMPANMTASTGTALPNSSRVGDVTKAQGEAITWTSSTNGNPVAGTNEIQQFGWEYVWHCHILGHEENDFMRPMVLNVAASVPADPSGLTAAAINPTTPNRVDLSWTDNSTNETGFSIQRSEVVAGAPGPYREIATVVPEVHAFSDFNLNPQAVYVYQVVAYNQAGNSAPSNSVPVNAPASVQMSGTVTTFNGASKVPLAGVTLTFTDTLLAVTTTAVTDATGSYTAALPYLWTGTLTPALAGFVFTPANRTYATGLTLNQTGQDFAARTATLTLSGTVTSLPAGAAAVTIAASTGQTATVAADGTYSLVLPNPFTGTITPSATGLIFNPAARSYSGLTVDLAGQTFAAQVQITGAITYVGAPLAGVTMNYTGGSTVTNASGLYTITVPAGWSGTVTPFLSGFFFTAASTSYPVLTAGTATNYTAAPGREISGQIYINSVPLQPLGGVTITFSNGGGTAVTDVNGFYIQFVPTGWSGTATPTSAAGYGFNPASRTYTNVTTTQSARNYTALVKVTGKVTNFAALGGRAVSINFNNGGGTVLSSTVDGTYSITLNGGWTGTVTASLAGHGFNSYTVVAPGLTAPSSVMDFTATQSISGRTRARINGTWVNIPGVTVSLSTGQTAISDANGNFTLGVPAGWSGSLSASGGGYPTWTVTTGASSWTNLTTNVTGLRITGL